MSLEHLALHLAGSTLGRSSILEQERHGMGGFSGLMQIWLQLMGSRLFWFEELPEFSDSPRFFWKLFECKQSLLGMTYTDWFIWLMYIFLVAQPWSHLEKMYEDVSFGECQALMMYECLRCLRCLRRVRSPKKCMDISHTLMKPEGQGIVWVSIVATIPAVLDSPSMFSVPNTTRPLILTWFCWFSRLHKAPSENCCNMSFRLRNF